MGKTVILDGVYTQVPAGWVSAEKVQIGTLRMIDDRIHYAMDSWEDHNPFRPPFWPKTYETLWVEPRQLKNQGGAVE